MSVCSACKASSHSGQPLDCPGGTWCDCQHRRTKLMVEPETPQVREEPTVVPTNE